MEESVGERMLDIVARSASGYPRKETLKQIGGYCHAIGGWLKAFQTDVDVYSVEKQETVDLLEYVDIRLEKLRRLANLKEEERNFVLHVLEQFLKAQDAEKVRCQVHGDLSLSNIIILRSQITFLDFAMYHIGSPYNDLSYFYQRLENFLTNPFFRCGTIRYLQEAFLDGYDPNFNQRQSLFLAYRVRNFVNRLVDLARTDGLPVVKRLYQQRQYKKCFDGLTLLLQSE